MNNLLEASEVSTLDIKTVQDLQQALDDAELDIDLMSLSKTDFKSWNTLYEKAKKLTKAPENIKYARIALGKDKSISYGTNVYTTKDNKPAYLIYTGESKDKKRLRIFKKVATNVKSEDISFTYDPKEASIFRDEDVKLLTPAFLKALNIKDKNFFVKDSNVSNLELQQELLGKNDVSKLVLRAFWLSFNGKLNSSASLEEKNFPELQVFNRDISSFIKNNGLSTKENTIYELIKWSQSTAELRDVFTLDAEGQERFNFLKQHIAEGEFKWRELLGDPSDKLILQLVRDESYYEEYTTIAEVKDMLNIYKSVNAIRNLENIKNEAIRKLVNDLINISKVKQEVAYKRLARNIVLEPAEASNDIKSLLNGDGVDLISIKLGENGTKVRSQGEIEEIITFMNTATEESKDPETSTEQDSYVGVVKVNGEESTFEVSLSGNTFKNKKPFVVGSRSPKDEAYIELGIEEDGEFNNILLRSLGARNHTTGKDQLLTYFKEVGERVTFTDPNIESVQVTSIEIKSDIIQKFEVGKIQRVQDQPEPEAETNTEETTQDATDTAEEETVVSDPKVDQETKETQHASETVDGWEGKNPINFETFKKLAKAHSSKDTAQTGQALRNYLQTVKLEDVKHILDYFAEGTKVAILVSRLINKFVK